MKCKSALGSCFSIYPKARTPVIASLFVVSLEIDGVVALIKWKTDAVIVPS